MAAETILVVDDTDDLRRLTGTILELAGFDIIEARNGTEALARATEKPDLIVLDVHMPDMDGFEVCRRLKASPETASIPVLYLSAAYRDERHRIRGLEAGAAAYLTRPLDPSDLVATVQAVMRLGHAARDREIGADRYHRLFDHAADGVWTADTAGRITYVNDRLAAMLDLPPRQLLGRAFVDFIDPSDREAARQRLDRQQLGITDLREFRCIRADAVELWVMLSAMPLVDDGGATRGTVGLTIDVTERKRTERALLRLAAIVEASDDAILSETLDGVVLTWNPGAERMFGYSATEVMGRSISMLVPPEQGAELAEIMRAVRAGQRAYQTETLRRRKDGSILVVSLSVSPIQDAAGRIIAVSTIARDVTDRKRAERAEREADALRSVTQLATAAAHEINNPLTVLLGTLALIERSSTPLDPEVSRRLERVRDAAHAIQHTVQQMSRITRLHQAQQPPGLPEMLDLFASAAESDPDAVKRDG